MTPKSHRKNIYLLYQPKSSFVGGILFIGFLITQYSIRKSYMQNFIFVIKKTQKVIFEI